jgi:hypothetical protein
MRKVVITVCTLAIIVFGALLTIDHSSNSNRNSAVSSVPSTTSNPATSTSSNTSTSPESGTTTSSSSQGGGTQGKSSPPNRGSSTSSQGGRSQPQAGPEVLAAAESMVELTPAMFYTAHERDLVIRRYAAPTVVSGMELAYNVSAADLARSWGYVNVIEANSSNYQVVVQKYRVVRMTSYQATVDLYTVTDYTTEQGDLYEVPAISVVDMQKVDGKWLYAGAYSPSTGEAPPPQSGLSIKKTEELYLPYLKGYVSYNETN